MGDEKQPLLPHPSREQYLSVWPAVFNRMVSKYGLLDATQELRELFSTDPEICEAIEGRAAEWRKQVEESLNDLRPPVE